MPAHPKQTPSRCLRKARSLCSIRQKHESTTPFGLQPSCLLLQLPAELRNSIYEYALTGDRGPEERIALHTLRLPPLAYACRQTFFETSWIFFSCTPFTLTLRETEHARIPKLLEPMASNTMAMLKRYGVENIPIADVRIEKQQPQCGRIQGGKDFILLASFAAPKQPNSTWFSWTNEVWTTWKPKLEAWKMRNEDQGSTIEDVIAVGQFMHKACRRVWLNPAVFLYVNLVYRDVRKLNKWREEGAIPAKMPVRAYDHLQRIKARMDRRS